MKIEEEIKQIKFEDSFHKVVLNIRFTGNWLYNTISRVLKPYGISEEQYNVLRILKGQHPQPSPLQLISERMINRMSNATRLVEKLRRQGLVSREVCPKNRRKVDILITEQGLNLLKEIKPKLDQEMQKVNTITLKEAEQLNRLLDKIRQ